MLLKINKSAFFSLELHLDVSWLLSIQKSQVSFLSTTWHQHPFSVYLSEFPSYICESARKFYLSSFFSSCSFFLIALGNIFSWKTTQDHTHISLLQESFLPVYSLTYFHCATSHRIAQLQVIGNPNLIRQAERKCIDSQNLKKG